MCGMQCGEYVQSRGGVSKYLPSTGAATGSGFRSQCEENPKGGIET